MSYAPVRTDSEGNLPIRRSVTAGAVPTQIRPGELAVNAADGCLYVGTTTGSATPVPGAPGITQIVTLSQAAYDLITATASTTTLYIVTPNP